MFCLSEIDRKTPTKIEYDKDLNCLHMYFLEGLYVQIRVTENGFNFEEEQLLFYLLNEEYINQFEFDCLYNYKLCG